MQTMRKVARGGAVAAATLLLLSAAEWAVAAGPAKEGSFRGMTCFTSQTHVIAAVKGYVGVSFDAIGTLIRKEGELGYLASEHCVGSTTIIGKELTQHGSCVSTDPDGDHNFVVFSRRNKEKGKWKVVAGDGKYQGMEASGTWYPAIVPVKQVRAGVHQECNKETGHWKLK